MSTPWGPFTLTPGVPVKVTIGGEISAIQLHNESPYIVYISFGDAIPTALDGTTGAYDGAATPWAHPVLSVQRAAATPAERALNAIRDFHGSIWLMPVLPPQARITAGNVTQFAYAIVEAFTTQDQPPQPWAVSRESIEISQQRTVMIPMNAPGLVGRNVTLVNGADITLRSDGLNSPPPISSDGLYVAYTYLYWAKIGLQAPAVGSGVNADVTLFADLMATAVVLLSTAVHHMWIVATQANGPIATIEPDEFYPPVGESNRLYQAIGGTVPTAVRWRLHVNNIAGAPVAWWNFGVQVDLTNSVSPGTQGNFAPNTGVF